MTVERHEGQERSSYAGSGQRGKAQLISQWLNMAKRTWIGPTKVEVVLRGSL